MQIQYPTFEIKYKSDVKTNSKRIVKLIQSLPENNQGGFTESFLVRELDLSKKEVKEALLYDWRQESIGKESFLTCWVNQAWHDGQLRHHIKGQYQKQK